MKPLVIVQSSPTKNTAVSLAQAARDRGYDIQDVSFSSEQEQIPRIDDRRPVFVYGSVALVRDWSSKYPELSDWIWYDQKRLGPACWKEFLGSHFLNSDGEQTTAKNFRESWQAKNKSWHVRPVLNDKKPAGGVYSSNDPKIQSLEERCELWVSLQKPIMDEVRVWIVGDQPITASQYRKNKCLVSLINNKTTEDAMKFAKFISALFLPHTHCVMDLAKDFDGKWTVIEFNPIHGSGWYGADAGEILDAFVSFYEFNTP